MVVILAGITIFQKSNYGFKDTTDYAKLGQLSLDQQQAYKKYLADIQTDPVASQQLLQTIITQADIKKELDAHTCKGNI